VSTTSFFLGSATSTPFRLCSRAPRISTWSSSKLFIASTNSESRGNSTRGLPMGRTFLVRPRAVRGVAVGAIELTICAADASFPARRGAVYGWVATREPTQPTVAERDTNRMLRTNFSGTTPSSATTASSAPGPARRITAPKSAAFRWATATVLAAGLLVGCKNQQKCDEALQTARQALQDDYLDFALARQWREHAGKICGAGSE